MSHHPYLPDHPLLEHFEPSKVGSFLRRFGPAFDPDVPYSQKKLCFTAANPAILIEVLHDLTQRDTCYFVKFSTVPRGGLFLGRCFFLDDDEAGRTWAYYKNHPLMFCQVQDDDFTDSFRPCKSWLNSFDHLWDHSNPPATEEKFREHLRRFGDILREDRRLQLRTQIARALGLQRRFDEAQAELDAIYDELPDGESIAAVRAHLEAGRLLNSQRIEDRGLGDFTRAYDMARLLDEDALATDAAHMLAIITDG